MATTPDKSATLDDEVMPLWDEPTAPSTEPPGDEPHGLAAIEAELAEQLTGDPEPDEPELISLPTWQGQLPETLMRIVDARIGVWQRVLDMEDRRGELKPLCTIREIKDEVGRQSREAKKLPPVEGMKATYKRLQQRLEDPVIKSEFDPASLEPGFDPQKTYVEILQMGATQLDILLKRARLDAGIPESGLPAAREEPLFTICEAHGVNATPLLSWTYYALGVQQRIAEWRVHEDAHRQKLAQAKAEDKKNKGLRSVLSGNSRTASEVPPLDTSVVKGLRAAYQEMQSIEPQLTELFWALYEDVAWLLVQGQVAASETPVLRAFLRHGLVCAHPALNAEGAVEAILKECATDVYDWPNTPEATHVAFADEYIEGIAGYQLTVSPDEDLELNNRGSDEWKADRIWRLAAISRQRLELIRGRYNALGDEIETLNDEVQARQTQIEKIKNNAAKKPEATALMQENTAAKAQISRLIKAGESIQGRLLNKMESQASDAMHRLEGEKEVLSLEAVVRREARFIRRTARLAARLREPFPQFVLRDHYQPGGRDLHTRELVLDNLRELEENDTTVFHHLLVPNKKADRQVTVRMSPVFLLTPCRGQMGFCFCERKWDDNGRMVLPTIAQRQGMLGDLLIDMLADFRWDCSKEAAGMDWITADALCSAYATVRWNTRKLPERAQKMMGINPKLKDKPNWRAHYRLFVTSAKEQGRLLFSKCDEIYKMVIKYIGLPPGIEALKRD